MKTKNLLLTATAIFAAALSMVAQTIPSYVPKNGLIAWYPFNGNANDESGNGNNGTNNGASLVQDRFGNINKALDFNGTSNYIDVADNNTLDLSSTFTISGWYNTTATNANLYTLVGKSRDIIGGTGYLLAYGIPSSTLSLNWGPNITLNIPSAIYNSGWHFMVGTSDGSDIKIYMDSVMIQSMSTSPNLINSTASLNIGRENSILGRYFLGKLDDIGIWNRALTQAEITKLYGSNTTGMQEAFEKESIIVFPNPAKSKLHIEYSNYTVMNGYTIKITNAIGANVYTSSINKPQLDIDLLNLSGGGIYFITTEDELNNIVDVRKVLIL